MREEHYTFSNPGHKTYQSFPVKTKGKIFDQWFSTTVCILYMSTIHMTSILLLPPPHAKPPLAHLGGTILFCQVCVLHIFFLYFYFIGFSV